MSESILIPFVPDDSLAGSAEYWVHMEQVEASSEVATLGEVAALVDTTFGVDPCNTDASGEPTVTQNPVTIATAANEVTEEATDYLNSVIQSVAGLSLCDWWAGEYPPGSYKTQIKIGKSHQDEDYVLRFSNGKALTTTIVKEIFFKVYEIKEATSLELPFPAFYSSIHSSKDKYEFENVVMGPYGYQTPPTVVRSGRDLSWGGISITGYLTVSYHCIYDLVDVVVYGDADGNAGDCNVLCFYHGTVEELSLTEPEDSDATATEKDDYCGVAFTDGGTVVGDRIHHVTCYETVTYNYICRCSPDSTHHSETIDVVVPCPNPEIKCSNAYSVENDDGSWSCEQYIGSRTEIAAYVSCGDTIFTEDGDGTLVGSETDEEQVISEAWYYEDKCCHAPEGGLPQCQVTRAKNPGKALDEDVLAALVAKWGSNLSIIPVSPADGDCGYIETVVNVPNINCCVDGSPLEKYTPDPLVVPALSYVMVTVEGGVLPLTWSVNTTNLRFANGETSYTIDSRTIKLYSISEGTCPSELTVTDGCTAVSWEMEATSEPPEIYKGGGSANLVVAPGGLISIALTVHGVSPLEWGSSTLEHLGNGVFEAPADFCGSTTVTVTDACGDSDTASVLSTAGSWVRVPSPWSGYHCNEPPEEWVPVSYNMSGKAYSNDMYMIAQQIMAFGYTYDDACPTAYCAQFTAVTDCLGEDCCCYQCQFNGMVSCGTGCCVGESQPCEGRNNRFIFSIYGLAWYKWVC